MNLSPECDEAFKSGWNSALVALHDELFGVDEPWDPTVATHLNGDIRMAVNGLRDVATVLPEHEILFSTNDLPQLKAPMKSKLSQAVDALFTEADAAFGEGCWDMEHTLRYACGQTEGKVVLTIVVDHAGSNKMRKNEN